MPRTQAPRPRAERCTHAWVTQPANSHAPSAGHNSCHTCLLLSIVPTASPGCRWVVSLAGRTWGPARPVPARLFLQEPPPGRSVSHSPSPRTPQAPHNVLGTEGAFQSRRRGGCIYLPSSPRGGCPACGHRCVVWLSPGVCIGGPRLRLWRRPVCVRRRGLGGLLGARRGESILPRNPV